MTRFKAAAPPIGSVRIETSRNCSFPIPPAAGGRVPARAGRARVPLPLPFSRAWRAPTGTPENEKATRGFPGVAPVVGRALRRAYG